jgi:hypothetical protein
MSMTAHLFNTSVGLRVSVDHPDHHEFIFSLTLLLTIKRTNKQNKQPKRKLPRSFHTITKMKFSTIALTALLACASTALADTLFHPTGGAILSNVDSVAQLSPQVVMDYLVECAGVSTVMSDLPEDANCLIDNFIRLEFPGDEFGNDYCSTPPNLELPDITEKLEAANNLCTEDFSAHMGAATFLFFQVFEADSCWSSLCNQEEDDDDDDALLSVESHYIEQCSGVELPYPLESFDGMMSVIDNEARDNAILTCMLDYVMDAPAAQFGFDEPPVPCFPPAYDENMQVTCPDVLAKPVYDHCTANSVYFEMLQEDQMFMTTSMSMSMSMAMDEDDNDFKIVTEEMLQMRFCAILNGLTTDKGLECLVNICDNPSVMPSSSPSLSSDMPSSSPSLSSDMPSSSPSLSSSMPSSSPSLSSAMPSDTPSLRPSSVPSRLPTASPSSAPSSLPSRVPSSAPSMAPSAAPSSAPTLIVSNPEGVQTSLATAVSVGVATFVLLAATLVAVA